MDKDTRKETYGMGFFSGKGFSFGNLLLLLKTPKRTKHITEYFEPGRVGGFKKAKEASLIGIKKFASVVEPAYSFTRTYIIPKTLFK